MTSYCSLCSTRFDCMKKDHCITNQHRYKFYIWSYEKYRKPLTKDRKNVQVAIAPKVLSSIYQVLSEPDKGHFGFQINPEIFIQASYTVQFLCTVTNNGSQIIFLTKIDFMHRSEYFRIDVGSLAGGKAIGLKSGSSKDFEITFSMKELGGDRQVIPIFLSFQYSTDDGESSEENTLLMIKHLMVTVSDSTAPVQTSGRGHFTNKEWGVKDVIGSVRPPTLDSFPVPLEYRTSLVMGLEYHREVYNQQDIRISNYCKRLLQHGVNPDNYKLYYHILLWMEEIAEALCLEKYNMENVSLKKCGQCLEMKVEGLAEKRPSIIKGDNIEICISDDFVAYRGVIKEVQCETVIISDIDDRLLLIVGRNPHLKYDVRFILGRVSFERPHFATEHLSTKMIANLFPSPLQVGQHLKKFQLLPQDIHNKTILTNPEQMQAVENILNQTSGTVPYIVFGPPGTGKTITIVEAMIQILRNTSKRILVGAPSNAACDVILEKLAPYCTKEEVLRINSEAREACTFRTELQAYCNNKTDKKPLNSFRIVISTLVHIGKYKFTDRNYQPHCVFIDEAAQALEPAVAVPLSFLQTSNCQIVLAGDHKQLSAIVMSKKAAEYRLGVSLLERLIKCPKYRDGDPHFIIKLKQNFRSHPDIISLPNSLYYNDELKPVATFPLIDPISKIPVYPYVYYDAKKIKTRQQAGAAVEFHGISSKERRAGKSPSYFNNEEVTAVVNCVDAFFKFGLDGDFAVKDDDIGVITPYARQVRRIIEELSRRNHKITVGTAEIFQGNEKRIIIISTVRAQNNLLKFDHLYKLGFVSDDKRFNVILTRAISKLIIIGCPTVLQTDEKWRRLIDFCDTQLHSYYGFRCARRSMNEFQQDCVNKNINLKVKNKKKK